MHLWCFLPNDLPTKLFKAYFSQHCLRVSVSKGLNFKKCSLLLYKMPLGSLSLFPVQVRLLRGKAGLGILVFQEAVCWEVHGKPVRRALIWSSLLAHQLPFALQKRNRKKKVSVFTPSEVRKLLFDKQRDFFLQCFQQKSNPSEARGHRIWWLQEHDIDQVSVAQVQGPHKAVTWLLPTWEQRWAQVLIGPSPRWPGSSPMTWEPHYVIGCYWKCA